MVVLITTFLATGPVLGIYYSCVVLEVAILQNRAHVLCAEPPVKSRGGYPRDTGHPIMYFALPLSDGDYTNRFVNVSNLALQSGHTMFFSYTSGDYSGEAYDCDRANCRKPWAFGLEKFPSTP